MNDADQEIDIPQLAYLLVLTDDEINRLTDDENMRQCKYIYTIRETILCMIIRMTEELKCS